MKVSVLPMSRVLHVRDEAQAMSLLREYRPELDDAERRELAWRLACGYALLVLDDEFEVLDPIAPHHDADHDSIHDLDPPPPPPVAATWFELRVCDELGEPIAGIRIHVLVDGTTVPLPTDADGRVRVDSPDGASFASAWVADADALRELLAARWSAIRDGTPLEPADERTFVTCTAAADGRLARVQLAKHTRHTLVFHPDVTLVRFVGVYFDTSRSFLLPNGDIPQIRTLYERMPAGDLLVVGHTDTVGNSDFNDALALERARSVTAYLRDDVDTWLACWTQAMPADIRWGAAEDRIMLDEILRRDPRAPRTSRLRYFQRARGLGVDGKIGDETRRALVTEYMALDAVTVPTTMTVATHGCGEHHPLDEYGEELDDLAPDELADVVDRRVELFFFADRLGVLPPASGPISDASAPQYAMWRRHARQTQAYSKLPKRLLFCFST